MLPSRVLWEHRKILHDWKLFLVFQYRVYNQMTFCKKVDFTVIPWLPAERFQNWDIFHSCLSCSICPVRRPWSHRKMAPECWTGGLVDSLTQWFSVCFSGVNPPKHRVSHSAVRSIGSIKREFEGRGVLTLKPKNPYFWYAPYTAGSQTLLSIGISWGASLSSALWFPPPRQWFGFNCPGVQPGWGWWTPPHPRWFSGAANMKTHCLTTPSFSPSIANRCFALGFNKEGSKAEGSCWWQVWWKGTSGLLGGLRCGERCCPLAALVSGVVRPVWGSSCCSAFPVSSPEVAPEPSRNRETQGNELN